MRRLRRDVAGFTQTLPLSGLSLTETALHCGIRGLAAMAARSRCSFRDVHVLRPVRKAGRQ